MTEGGVCCKAAEELTLMGVLDKAKSLMGRIDEASKQYGYTLNIIKDPFDSYPIPENCEKEITPNPKTYLEYLDLTLNEINSFVGSIEYDTKTLSTIIGKQ